MMAISLLLLLALFLFEAIRCSGSEGWLVLLNKLNAQTSQQLSERLRSVTFEEVASDNVVVELFHFPVFYKQPVALLRADALDGVKLAASLADKLGLTLKIYDCFRPVEADVAISEKMGCQRMMNKSRGVVVDLTLMQKGGSVLDMGGEYDGGFGAHMVDNLNIKQIKNRALLAGIMSSAGFIVNPNAWWRFDFISQPNMAKYPMLYDSKLRTGIVLE